MTIAFVIVTVVLVAWLLWWLLIETEGVYLGRGVVIWLYDVYATRYDDIKQFEPEYDRVLLAKPIMEIIAPHKSPMMLDVATGTGRFPISMMAHPEFQGRIVGLDLSKKMLKQAAKKLEADRNQVELLVSPAEDLPFPDDVFDVVTCLEALEFMVNPKSVLCEIARVLRPGGLLLMTNRIDIRMPRKVFSGERLTELLAECEIEDVMIEPWQEDYHRVWGTKVGNSLPTGARPLIEVLQCSVCRGVYSSELLCEQCGNKAPVI